MSNVPWKTALVVMSIGAAAPAGATIIYGGGASYTIQAPINDNVQVVENAHLVIGSGGTITGIESTERPPAAVSVNSADLDVVGNARIQAGGSRNALDTTGSRAVVRLGDEARITGNIHNSYVNSVGCCNESASHRLYVSDRAVVDGNIVFAGYLRVEDQAAVLGDIWNNGSYGLDMRGGVVAGTVHMHSIDGYWLNMEGGAILGGVDARNNNDVQLTMSGGYIGNGFRADRAAAVRGEIRGGQIDGGIIVDSSSHYAGSSDLTISGGQFNADAGDWLLHFSDNTDFTGYSDLSIWGGQFGYQESGLGFLIDNRVNFDIHGRDLLFANGWLTGHLLDGSWLNTALTFGSGWSGTFTIHNVPEPATMSLLIASLFGVFAFRRSRA